MNKKILSCLLALMLLLSVAAASFAELTYINDGLEGAKTVIYYVPATNDAAEMTTAKCVAKAIVARWPDRTEILCGRYNSINALQPISNEQGYKTVFAKGTDTGDGQLNKKNRPNGYEGTACEFWFIVPREAADRFISNMALMDNIREMLVFEGSVLHVVFVGNETRTVAPESALGMMAAEGKADWVFVGSDFLAASPANPMDGNLHTGNYFIASMYGSPVDLAAVPAEDGRSWTFDLPESSKALVLIDWNDKTGTAEFKDAAGNPCPLTGTLIMSESKYAYKTATMLTKMEAGTYSVTVTGGSAASVHVYWYPDLNELMPQMQLADIWNRGENEIVLALGKMLCNPENYTVQFVYQDNEDAASATTLFADYDAGRNAWVKKVSVGMATEHVYITPSIRLNMIDGNRIWEWKADRIVRDVLAAGISVRSEAPTEQTIYTDNAGGATGSVSYKWSEIFNFNADDQPAFDVTSPAGEQEPAVLFSKLEDGSGFRVYAAAGEGLAETVTLTVSGKVNDEERTHEIIFTRSDVSALCDGIQFVCAQGDDVVNIGDPVKIIVEMPAETIAGWQQACSQLPAFPALDTLRFFCAPDGQEYGEGTALTGDPLTAEFSLNLPADMKTGTAQFKAEIMTEGRERSLAQKMINVNVLNRLPEMYADQPFEGKISMAGFPWAYQKVDSLLKACFGTDSVFDLYTDYEDNLSSVRVTVENIQGLELPDYGEKNGDIWTFEVTNPGDTVEIAVAEPGEHIIRLSATDGVNESEVFEGKVKVYSEVLKYVSYAAAGLAALLLLLVIILIIRYISKPSFKDMYIRCYASSDDDPEKAEEILSKTDPVPMTHFRKKGVLLSTILIIFRQPVLSKEYRSVADDITVFPAKSSALRIIFGKEAMKTIGRHDKRETVQQGNKYRMRIGSVYIEIENVRP